jgi:hypothetical protein
LRPANSLRLSADAAEQIIQGHEPLESADLFADAFSSQQVAHPSMRPDDTQWYGTVRKMLIVALSLPAPVRKSASILFEKSDYDQENHRPDDGVDDRCDDAADKNKAGQWQKPTCQDGADNADDDVTKNSKTVALDE